MDTLPLCFVNRVLNGLNIHDIAVVAGHNDQALVTRVSASSWIPEHKLKIYGDYGLTFCYCNIRILLGPAGALRSNATGAAGFMDVKYCKLLCYYSSWSLKSRWCHNHFESGTLYHNKMFCKLLLPNLKGRDAFGKPTHLVRGYENIYWVKWVWKCDWIDVFKDEALCRGFVSPVIRYPVLAE
jgi:hypothetical protein